MFNRKITALAASDTLLTAFTNLPEMFSEGSPDGTKALPSIWRKWKTFNNVFETGGSGRRRRHL